MKSSRFFDSGIFKTRKAKAIGTSILGGTKISLAVIEKLLEGVPAPFARGAVGAALELINTAEVRSRTCPNPC